jgi:hypothetical protein
MRVRTQRRIGAALVGVMVIMLAVMVVLFVRLPEDTAPADEAGPTPVRVTERVAAVEAVFCDLLNDSPDLDRRMGTALNTSGELQHRTLGALAAEWSRTGAVGARAQVLTECRRLGLIA